MWFLASQTTISTRTSCTDTRCIQRHGSSRFNGSDANLSCTSVVKSLVELDVRPAVVAAVVLLIVFLAVAFVRSARAIRKEHRARVTRMQRRLEEDATALVDWLLRRD